MVPCNCAGEMSFGRTFKFVNLSGNCAAAGTAANTIAASTIHFQRMRCAGIGFLLESSRFPRLRSGHHGASALFGSAPAAFYMALHQDAPRHEDARTCVGVAPRATARVTDRHGRDGQKKGARRRIFGLAAEAHFVYYRTESKEAEPRVAVPLRAKANYLEAAMNEHTRREFLWRGAARAAVGGARVAMMSNSGGSFGAAPHP